LLRTYVNGIEEFQIIQEEFGQIILKMVIQESFNEKEKQKLLKKVYDYCGEKMKVDIQFVDKIPLTESGKHRYIISKISPFVK